MPTLESSAVKVRHVSYLGWDRNLIRKEVELLLNSQGSEANPITADVLGFSRISESSIFTSDSDLPVLTCPNYEGTLLFLLDEVEGQDIPVDITGSVRGVVIGVP